MNGTPIGRIIPTRGICQGDPISPYLFLLFAEALSSMLTREESRGMLTSVPTSKRGPQITHIFFADDNLLFVRLILSIGTRCLIYCRSMRMLLVNN